MSRIGNREIQIPNNTSVIFEKNYISVKGIKGLLQLNIPSVIKIKIENNILKTIRINNIKHTKQLHGTINSLIKGMIIGVNIGFKKELEIIGLGYKTIWENDQLILYLGKSHLIYYKIPAGINITVLKSNKIIIEGISKQLVGEVAATIRNYKKPEPYKGKGIRYKNEYIRLKEGKSISK